MAESSRIESGFVTTDDDVRLYYRVIGDGPLLVCCNGVGVSTFFWKYIVAHFRKNHRLVLWDYRGHGRSGSPPDVLTCDVSMERNAKDLHCILAHLNTEAPPVFLGHSMGCQVILEYYKHYPQQCRALIPMFGTFSRPLDTFMNFKHSRSIFEGIRKIANLGGG